MDIIKKNPFFSIITPVYNVERYIGNCIDSVIKQTYSSWELILVDDGSTDTSGNICDEYKNDSRIKVLHQNNKGAFRSRLKGISIATGEYTIGLDADDFLDPECLETIKNAIELSESDLIFYGFRHVGDQEGNCRCSLPAGGKYAKEDVLKEIIKGKNHSLCNKAIKLEIVKGVDFNCIKNKRILNDDYALIVPIVCKVESAYVINDVLYNYRIYSESSSNVMCTVEYILDTDFVTDFIISRLDIEKLMDKNIYQLVYLSYLDMISGRLITLFLERRITKEECTKIQLARSYIQSEKYESYKYFRQFEFIVLKLFRKKQYGILKFIMKMIRTKKKMMSIVR